MIDVKKQWLGKVGGIEVDRGFDVRRSGVMIPRAQEPNGVLHTTEGHFFPSLSVFKSTGTPTFMLGYEQLKVANGKLTNLPAAKTTKIRVAQFMPIGEMALTLKNAAGGTETNREALVQIELVGTCVQGSNGWGAWLPDDPVLTVLADLFKQLWEVAGIPLQRAGDGTRSVARWDGKAGWFGHLEAPENDHTDPRNIGWSTIFKRATPLVKVHQIRSGKKVLFQTPAKAIDGISGVDRVGEWIKTHERKVREAERESFLRIDTYEVPKR